MRARRLAGILGAALATCACGCDPVRTTLQTVHLRVSDTASGRPLAGAEVGMKYDYERAEPLSQETHDDPQTWHEHLRRSWEDFPWAVGTTDAAGDVAVGIGYTRIDQTPSFWTAPPEWRDESDKPHLVRVNAAGVTGVLSVMLRRRAASAEKSFSVVLTEVGPPRYVWPGWSPRNEGPSPTARP